MPDRVSFHMMGAPIPDLEALGLQYLRRRAAVMSFAEPTDAIHILNPTEQAALRRIERGMVLRAPQSRVHCPGLRLRPPS
ncbi:MAG: hypothetical protein ACREK4_18215 [Candidatus Rokuibacteriota bacterium]